MNNAANRIPSTLIFAVALIYFMLRLHNLERYGLWSDEIGGVKVASLPLPQLLQSVGHADPHPPLFYLLLKVWITIGENSLVWLRLLPISGSVIALIPLLGLCRTLRLTKLETLVVLTMMSVNGTLIYYAQEVRMYSFSFLFSTCSLWLFFKWLGEEHQFGISWVSLTVANLLLILNHAFGWLLIGSEMLIILLLHRHRVIPAIVSVLTTVTLFAPWVVFAYPYQLSQEGLVRQVGWIEIPSWRSVYWFYGGLNGSIGLPGAGILSTVIFSFPVIFGFASLRALPVQDSQDVERKTLLALLFLAVVPVLVVFVASKILPASVWAPRGLIICATPYFLLVTLAACRLPQKRWRMIFVSGILLWSLGAGIYYLTRDDIKLNWSQLAKVLVAHARSNESSAPVYCTEEFLQLPLEWAIHDAVPKAVEVVDSFEAIPDSGYYLVFRDIGAKAHKFEDVKQALEDGNQNVVLLYKTSTRSQTVYCCYVTAKNQD